MGIQYITTCFLTGSEGCRLRNEIGMQPRQVFVAMPFQEQQDAYKFGIKPAIQSLGFIPWRADERIANYQILCKVCRGIQTSRYAIVEVSKWNPNVLLELGIAYGLGRTVLLVKEKKAKIPTDLKGIEYIEYADAEELYTAS
jgi:hypothetical protein